jgi:hypothetical protein
MVNKMTALPPIELLQSLFHYNQVDGTITYLQQRGPKKPGDLADSTRNGLPIVYIHGKEYKAANVAWALAHGVDPADGKWLRYVICLDGNPFNLSYHNLAIQDTPHRYINPRGRRAKRPGWLKKDLRRNRITGEWTARYDGALLPGTFLTQAEAAAARRLAAREDAADG